MNKDKYLEDLYNQLKQYNVDSIMKHVTEYDYIISEMIEEDNEQSFDQVIDKLGTPKQLAQNIAEEFDYEQRNQTQFEEPLISKNKKYNPNKAGSVIASVINIIFVIIAIVYFITIGTSLLALILLNMMVGIISIPGMIFFYIAILAAFVCTIGIYMIMLNLKRMLVMSLEKTKEVSTNE